MHRIVGRIQIQHQLARCSALALDEMINQHLMQRHRHRPLHRVVESA